MNTVDDCDTDNQQSKTKYIINKIFSIDSVSDASNLNLDEDSKYSTLQSASITKQQFSSSSNFAGLIDDSNILPIDEDSDDNGNNEKPQELNEKKSLLDETSIKKIIESERIKQVRHSLPHPINAYNTNILFNNLNQKSTGVGTSDNKSTLLDLDNKLVKPEYINFEKTSSNSSFKDMMPDFNFSDLSKQATNTGSRSLISSVKNSIYKRETWKFATERVAGLSINNANCEVNKRIIINVGGVRYESYTSTLKLIPESRLANLSETNSDYDPIKNEYFFDRHPGAFISILNYFRTGKLHSPADLCGNLFHEELNFWGINQYDIEPCCWTTYSQQRDADEHLRKVTEKIENEGEEQDEIFHDRTFSPFDNQNKHEGRTTWRQNSFLRQYFRIRPKVWRFFNNRHSSKKAWIFFWISVFVLFASIVNFVLETSSYFREPYDIATNSNLSRSEREERTQPHEILKKIEKFCNLFFMIEFILRFLFSPDKLRFLRNPYNYLEFLALLPFFFPTQQKDGPKTWAVKVHNYLEVFYILRILRIFALVPKYSGLKVLLLTIKTSLGELSLYVLLLLMTLMLFASFVFYAEQIYEVEKNPFDSILIGLWWAIVTMTTLGYGDIVPVTPFGRLVGGLCALCGLVFLALPIPVIVNNFTTYYQQAKAHQKLRTYVSQKKGLFNRAIALHFNTQPEPISTAHPSVRELNDGSIELMDSCVQTTIHKYSEIKDTEIHNKHGSLKYGRFRYDDKIARRKPTGCFMCTKAKSRILLKNDSRNPLNSVYKPSPSGIVLLTESLKTHRRNAMMKNF